MKHLKIFALAVCLIISACSKGNDKNANKKDQSAQGKSLSAQISDTTLSNQKITEIDLNNGVIPKPATFNDKFSYLQGLELGAQLKMAQIKPNPDFFALGLTHGFEGNDKFLTKAEMQAMANEVGKIYKDKMNVMMEKKKKEFQALGEKYKKEGEDFLKKNKANPDVKTTPSGLQYKVIKEGSGNNASVNDICYVYIKSSYIDGSLIESNFGKQAVPIPVNKSVMPAWREALMMLKPGSRYIFYSPSVLAYGSEGIFPTIPPYMAIVFEIELVKIEGKVPDGK